jgi:hypothetical protein
VTVIETKVPRTWIAAVLIASATGGVSEGDDGVEFFESKVRPLLAKYCYNCHSVRGGKQKGGLLLDSREGVRSGGDTGPALIAGNPSESLLIKAVHYRDPELQMPPDDRLDQEAIEVLEHWISIGAPDPREDAAGEVESEKGIDYDAGRQFWAFLPIGDPESPSVKKEDWPSRELDHFVLSKIEDAGLVPAPPADRRVLVRRVYLDLHGIPPGADEMESFLADDRPDAWSRLIDRLLVSPRYGERWGRHWLDVARYSDSNGMDENIAHPEAWRYRDYVIASFNDDKPFDRFVVEQLAGDLMPATTLAEKRSQTIGISFLSVGPKMLACDDPEKMRRDIVDEQLDTTGRAFMGLTLGCARCHDHKFDPVSIEDYYGLAGIFLSSRTMTNYNVVAKYHEHDLSHPEQKARWKKIDELEERRSKKKIPQEEKERLGKEIAALKAGLPRRFKVMGPKDDEVVDAKVHLRGNYVTLGETVPRRLLPVVSGLDQPPMPKDQSGRRQLASWIASPGHPLTARVIANRLWRWHFGRGIVPTPDNFGKLGERPSHPELLDHLATSLFENGWSLKHLQREILLSSTYRQSAMAPKAKELDPENALFARWGRRRMEAEVLRDSVLFLSRRLDARMGGGMLEEESNNYVNKGKMNEYSKLTRRTVYLPVIRSVGYDGLVAFDFADPSVPEGSRRSSTVTPQALFLMNSPLVHESSSALGKLAATKSTGEDRAAFLIGTILGRTASAAEVDRIISFAGAYAKDAGVSVDEPHAWAAISRSLFATNEFLYID